MLKKENIIRTTKKSVRSLGGHIIQVYSIYQIDINWRRNVGVVNKNLD